MAIFRNIQTSFWTDTKIIDDFTPEDRYFYLYLFTNPHNNMCGCYELSMKQVAVETGYDTEKVEALLHRFQHTHKVIIYASETKELLLINWHKYNWTSSPKFLTALTKQIGQVKNPEFKSYLLHLAAGADTVSIPYQPEAAAPAEQQNQEQKAQQQAIKTSSATAKMEEINAVAERWNALQDIGIKPVFQLTPHTKRYDMISARIAQYGLDNVLNAIDGIRKSSFLIGKNQRGWQITFDWFSLPNNFPKVLEGNYIDKQPVATEHEDINPYAEWS